jgi:hypothetical protein
MKPSTFDSLILELNFAREYFPPFNSAHEGYAIILEEKDELWDEVKRSKRDFAKMRAEAIQVAAMALRMVEDVCDYELAKSEIRRKIESDTNER